MCLAEACSVQAMGGTSSATIKLNPYRKIRNTAIGLILIFHILIIY